MSELKKKEFYVALLPFKTWHDQDFPYNICGYGFTQVEAVKHLATNVGEAWDFFPYNWTTITIRKFSAITHNGKTYLPIKVPRSTMYDDDDFSHEYEEYDTEYTPEHALNTRPEYIFAKAEVDKKKLMEEAEKEAKEMEERKRKFLELEKEFGND